MKVTLRCYGNVRSAAGRKELTLSIADATTVEELRAELDAEFADLDSDEFVIMKDGDHAAPELELADGDVLTVSEKHVRE